MADAPEWGFPNLSPVARWLLGQGLDTALDAPDSPLDESAWRTLCAEAGAHRIEGHLITAVSSGTLPTTRGQRAEVAELEVAASRIRTRYDEICLPVLDALAAAHIPIRLLKGSALPWSDYPDPQLRPTADLDLLVPGSRLLEAAAVLRALGGSEINPEPTAGFALEVFKGLTIRMPSGLEVDLHRILSWGPLGVRVPEADLWAPGRSFDRLGRAFVTLDAERTLIHVSAHLLLLGVMRASEVRDVAQLANSPLLDADRTIRIARRWGHEAILAVALRMAERELALATQDRPLFAWAADHRVSMRDRLWLRTDRPDAPIRGVEPFAVLVELPGLHSRITLLRALFAPRPGTDPSFGTRVSRTVRALAHRP